MKLEEMTVVIIKREKIGNERSGQRRKKGKTSMVKVTRNNEENREDSEPQDEF